MAYIKPNYAKEDMDKPEELRRIISYRIAIVRGKKDDGKLDYHWETVPGDSISAVKKRIRTLEASIDRQEYVKPTKLTTENYLQTWLKDVALPNMTPRTYEGYEFNVNKYLIPKIGNKTLTDLKAKDIQHLLADIQAAGHHRTAKYCYDTINKALNVAIKQGVIVRNPCEGVEIPRVPRHEMIVMDENGVQTFLEAAKKTPYYALFFTALFSGMRRSELLALRWLDVNLLLCTVSVNRTMHVMRSGHYKGKVIFKAPKSAKSRRLIPLSPSNTIILREHFTKQYKTRQELYSDNCPKCHKKNWDRSGDNCLKCLDCGHIETVIKDEDLVFCHLDGKPYKPDHISHFWMKLTRRNNLQGIRLHDARHTMATIMLEKGIHPKIVQERLGHSNISTTLDTYSHVIPGLQAAAAAKLDDIFKPKETKLEKELNAIIQN